MGISTGRSVGIVAAAVAAATAVRLLVDDPGPYFLVPVVVAGLLLGPRWALITAFVCTVLWMLTHEGGSTLLGGLIRGAIYGAVGWIVGYLNLTRNRLTTQLHDRDIELQELRTIQDALAPAEPPERPQLELATCYLPAEHGVSGDFFLVAPGRGDSTVIAIGDVAGRGLEAAKRAWYVRTLLATSAETTEDPALMLERANSALIEESGYEGPFVTAACMLFRPRGPVDWALAGHDDPISIEDGDPMRGDGERGLPLGVADALGCETSSADLGGAGALLYTDGLIEARRADDGLELFGEDRVTQLAAELGPATPAEVVESVQSAVQRFTGGSLADDLCLVALRSARGPISTEAR